VPGLHNRNQTDQVFGGFHELFETVATPVASGGLMRIGVIAICLWCCGCGCFKEITQRPEVQASGMIGKYFVSKRELVLENRPSLQINQLELPERSYAPREVGRLAAGTRVRIVRVDHHCEVVGFMIFPMVDEHNTTLVKIESGPFAGKRVRADQGGLSIEPNYIANELWTPCDQSTTLPTNRVR
jgi:hypothetical protein